MLLKHYLLQNDDSYVSDKINSINELNKKQLELYAHQINQINELVHVLVVFRQQ